MCLPLPFRKLAICWCLAAASPILTQAESQLIPQGGENQIIGSLPGDQTRPCAAVDSAGGFLVWQDNSATPLGLRILAQRLDNHFSALGAPILVSSAAKSKTAGDQEKPQVALLSGGGAVVVWQGGGSRSQTIYARFIGSNGIPLKSDIRVSAQTKLSQVDPAVATLTDGSVVVVWSSYGQDKNMWGVFARRFSAVGIPLGAEFQVNQFADNNQRSPKIASLTDNKFVVVWISELQRSAAGVDVYARIFNSNGVGGGELEINMSTNKACANPAVAGLPQGGFAVAWSQKDDQKIASPSDPQDPTGRLNPKPGIQTFSGTAKSEKGWDIYARFYGADGNPILGPSVVNTFVYGDQFAPSLSSAGTNYFAVWTSLEQDGDQREGVFGQLFSNDGIAQGSELHLNTTTLNRQFQPYATSNGSESFLTLWSGFIKSNGFDLVSRVYQLSTP